jgi:hypothetical protein
MTAKKAIQALIATVVLCLCTSVSHAEDIKLFLMGGGSTIVDKSSFTQRNVDYNTTYRRGGKAALGFEIPVTKLLGVEGAYSYGRDNLVLINNADVPTVETGYGIRNHRINGNAVLHSPTLFFGIRPYVTAGVEWDGYLPTSNAVAVAASYGFGEATSAKLQSTNLLGFNGGFGFELKVTPKFSVRLDARDHVTKSPTYQLPSAPTPASAAYWPITGSAQNLEYSLVILYHWRR